MSACTGKFAPGRVERQRLVALGGILGGHRVGLGAGPPHAEHLVARIGDGRRLLERRRVHHAPAPQQHEIGPALADLQPGRLLLDAGMGDRHQLERRSRAAWPAPAKPGSAPCRRANRDRRRRSSCPSACPSRPAPWRGIRSGCRRRPNRCRGSGRPSGRRCRRRSRCGHSRSSIAGSCRPAPCPSARR